MRKWINRGILAIGTFCAMSWLYKTYIALFIIAFIIIMYLIYRKIRKHGKKIE
jgi:preprotein translocase subunit YajC